MNGRNVFYVSAKHQVPYNDTTPHHTYSDQTDNHGYTTAISLLK